MKYEIHPLAELNPLMGEAELTRLITDIAMSGQRLPATLYEGKIIDGRHRAIAADRLGIELDVVEIEGSDEEAEAFVISMEERRHQTPEQLAVRLVKLLESEEATGGHLTNKHIADKIGVGITTVKDGKYVQKHNPEEFNQMREGSTSIKAAYKKTKADVKETKTDEGVNMKLFSKVSAANEATQRFILGVLQSRIEGVI